MPGGRRVEGVGWGVWECGKLQEGGHVETSPVRSQQTWPSGAGPGCGKLAHQCVLVPNRRKRT